MSGSVVISEFVDHLVSKHARSGTIQSTLEELRDKLAREVGPCNPDSFNEEVGMMLPGAPLDKSKLELWGDLQYVKGWLKTPVPFLIDLDCENRKCNRATRRTRGVANA